MGYYITQDDTQFTINAGEVSHANECLLSLFNKPDAKFAWISTQEVINSCKSKNFNEAMSECRWSVSVDANGNIFNIYFEGEKYGDEETIFNAIAPAVCDGSYITILGEEGESWRYFFKHGKVEIKRGVSAYGEVYAITKVTTSARGVNESLSSVYVDENEAMRVFAEMRECAINKTKEYAVKSKVEYYEPTTSLRTVSITAGDTKTIITLNEAPIS